VVLIGDEPHRRHVVGRYVAGLVIGEVPLRCKAGPASGFPGLVRQRVPVVQNDDAALAEPRGLDGLLGCSIHERRQHAQRQRPRHEGAPLRRFLAAEDDLEFPVASRWPNVDKARAGGDLFQELQPLLAGQYRPIEPADDDGVVVGLQTRAQVAMHHGRWRLEEGEGGIRGGACVHLGERLAHPGGVVQGEALRELDGLALTPHGGHDEGLDRAACVGTGPGHVRGLVGVADDPVRVVLVEPERMVGLGSEAQCAERCCEKGEGMAHGSPPEGGPVTHRPRTGPSPERRARPRDRPGMTSEPGRSRY